MHPVGNFIGGLLVRAPLPDDAAERRLNMARRAAEPVVEVEMAERGIEIIAPEQAYHTTAEPEAFGIGGGAPQQLLGLGKFIELLLRILGIAGRSLVRRLLLGALGVGRMGRDP